jgi:glycosyltransferase involved in cell wall biosynthesis
MEIIHVVLGKANPNRLNGVNKVVYNLATEQSKSQRKVTVWGITSNLVHDYPERNFKTVLFKAKRFPFFINSELKKAIQQNKSAVFHLHGGWIPVFSSLVKYFIKHQIKYVVTSHGAYNKVAMERQKLLKKVYFFFFEKKLINHAFKVHSIGQSEEEGLRLISPFAKSFLLPYGFHSEKSVKYFSKSTTFVVGYMGRLDVYTKGLDLLIDAFCAFQKKHLDSKLWIIGDGKEKKYLENDVRQKQMKNVHFWGGKFGEEKMDLMSKMHVFAHPSRNEGMPTAVLEAASLGTPSIVTHATNVAGFVAEYKAGIAIKNECVDDLVKGLETLYMAYQSQEAYMYINGAKKMLEEVFSWNLLVEKYDELYY